MAIATASSFRSLTTNEINLVAGGTGAPSTETVVTFAVIAVISPLAAVAFAVAYVANRD